MMPLPKKVTHRRSGDLDLWNLGYGIEGTLESLRVGRVSKANDGGAGGDESISRGTESQVFGGRAAGKRMRTRSSRNKANENPCLVDFSTSEAVVNLPPTVFLGSMLLRRWQ